MKTARNWFLNRDMVLNLVAVVATVAAVGVITSGRYAAGGDDQQPEMVFVSDWTELGSAGFRTGPDSAAVTIVVFIDLTCGACRVVDSSPCVRIVVAPPVTFCDGVRCSQLGATR